VSQLFSTDDNCGGCAKWQPDASAVIGWCLVLKMQCACGSTRCRDGYVPKMLDNR